MDSIDVQTQPSAPERRGSSRKQASIYFNKYIDGQPHACEAIELSATGMLVRRIHEPDAPRACYAVEIGQDSGDERLWLCATPVWRDGPFEALGFVGHSERDKARLEAFLARMSFSS